MKCHIANSVFIGNVDPFLAGFDTSDKTSLMVTTHDRWMSVHPVVLAMIAAKGLTLPKGSVGFDSITATSSGYFERMRLFSMLGVKSGITIKESDPSGRFVPLTQIRNANEQTRFVTDMNPLLHLGPEQAEPIRYIVSELIRNVLEHSGAENGAIVAAQYHKKSNIIRIGIADTGVGIKKTINRSHRAWNDMEALKLALTPGITGTTRREGGTQDNAGAGLFFIKSIATNNRNFFMLYSGNALYKLLKRPAGSKVRLHADPSADRHSEKDNLPYWQGTVVGIDLTLDDTGEFKTLMSVIGGVYSSAVRERKKLRYKKARFEP
jgi:anti-sigma regulatory factor (Ser/Thr protein kinase)